MQSVKLHIKKGDVVVVRCGKDSGKSGKVVKVFPTENRVIVEGINKQKRHQRAIRRDRLGGIIEIEGKIHASNVMLICPKCNRPTRTGRKFLENGKKVRYCKKCKEIIDK